MPEVFEWKCPECNKIVKSLYKEQFEVNKEQHILMHKRHQKPMERNKPLPIKKLKEDYDG